MRSLGSFLTRVMVWLVLLGAVAMLAVSFVVPRVTGATSYAVLTGSMTPDLPPGTLVVVRPVDVDDLAAGDVVTYQLESGDSTVVTHRIVEVQQRLDGETRFVTRGDANPVADPERVRPEQVRGRVWYGVPYVGRLYGMVGAQARAMAVLVLAGGLGLYALVMLSSAWRDRRDQISAARPQPGKRALRPAEPTKASTPKTDMSTSRAEEVRT